MGKTTLFITAFVLVFLSMGASCWSAELTKGEKDTILIQKVTILPSVQVGAEKKARGLELAGVAESLEAQFTNAVNATQVFQLVERKRFKDIEEEQNFAKALGDPNDKRAAKELMAAGAKFALLPQIDAFDDLSIAKEYQQIGRRSAERKLFVSVTVQVVDTTTGMILPDSPSVQVTKTESVDLTTGSTSGTQQSLVELAKETAGRLAQELVSVLRPAKVLAVTGKQVMINRGTEAGFKIGDEVEIYAVQEIKDDDSGQTFMNEVPVGKASVARSDKRQSFATIKGDDLGIAKGCVVRVVRALARTEISDAGGGAVGGVESPGSSEKPLKW